MNGTSERAASTPDTGIAAIVTFGVPLPAVDALAHALQGTAAEPARWFVFGRDAQLLGALDKVRAETIEMVMCVLPATDAGIVEAALDILRLEEVPAQRCVWLHGNDTGTAAPTGAGIAFTLQIDDPLQPGAVAEQLGNWVASRGR